MLTGFRHVADNRVQHLLLALLVLLDTFGISFQSFSTKFLDFVVVVYLFPILFVDNLKEQEVNGIHRDIVQLFCHLCCSLLWLVVQLVKDLTCEMKIYNFVS